MPRRLRRCTQRNRFVSLREALVVALLAGWAACGPSGDGSVDTAGWAEDLRMLRDSIHEIHPDPYRVHGPEEWQDALDSLVVRLPEMQIHEAALSVHRLAALAADGHTEPVRFAAHPFLRGAWLPLIFRRFADGWFVRTGHRRYAELFERRILRLGDLPVDTVASRARAFVSSDNRIGALDDVGNAMRVSAVLAAVGAVDSVGAPVEITVDGASRDSAESREPGRTVTVEPGIQSWVTDEWLDADEWTSAAPDPLYRSIESNYGYRYLPGDAVAYVWFGEIRDEEGQESIEDFFGRVLDEVSRRPVRRFVLDIRENPGGNLGLNGPVLHGVIRATSVDRPGRLFVVIGRDTYSAAMNLAVLLERHTHALFVGEPTGATPNHFGDTRTITLPHSGMEVEISALYWQNSDPRDHRPWIAPDLPAPLTSDDFFGRRDPALQAIRSFVATDSLRDSFGPPMARWRRPDQSRSWPPLDIR